MKPKPKRWTAHELEYLRKHYPSTRNADIAVALGRTRSSIQQCANKLKLGKSNRFKQSSDSGRLRPGQTPWNKGLPGSTGTHPNSRKHQYKKGQAPNNVRSVGSTRINKDGYLEIKTGDDLPFPTRRWELYHRLLWMHHHGPIPNGHVVIFKPGTHTTNPDQIKIKNLEIITRAQLMERNTVQRYPAELRGAMIQIGLLRGKLNERHQ